MALCLPPFLRLRLPSSRVSLAAPKGFAFGFRSFHSRLPFNQSVITSAASHEESHSELEVEREKDGVESEEESNEAWKQALEAFKVTLKETSEQLKIQAEKTRNDLAEIVKEMGEEGKEYLSTAAENSPPEVKEMVETFSSSTDDFNDVSKVLDFHVGIPYGFVLSVGGFLSFMVTGSIPAIRFGIILGGALLALSVLSLKAYQRAESFPLATKGQAVISSVLFLREFILLVRVGLLSLCIERCFCLIVNQHSLSLLFASVHILFLQRSNLCTFLTTLISGAVVAFYIFKLLSKDKPRLEPGTEN